MGRVLSGVQPTGNLHLGNYLGAIRHWVTMQEQHECLYCIVDLHAITVPQNPEELKNATLEVAAAYIACGIDPKHSAIFHQSAVPEHTELAWILGCKTPLGWLNRMTQFKEKAGKKKDQASLGLYGYPVLMAADILLYKATHVPVGEDQKQHLELARDIAGAFNREYDQDLIPLPEPLILGETTRVMSLRDGTTKMSKSDTSENSRIHLTDDNDTIARKIKKAKSDMLDGVTYDIDERPEATNLLNIYAALSGENLTAVKEKFSSAAFSDFKSDLADIAIAHLTPIREKLIELKQNPDYVQSVLEQGAEAARIIAGKNINEIKKTVGFLS